MKPTAKTTSESTKMDLLPDEVMLKAKQPSMSDEDRKVISHVVQRFDRMRSARVALDRLWQTYMLQYEAQFIPYAAGRSRSNVPLERAVIELFVSKSISRRSKEELRGIGDTDQGKVEIMRRVKDHVDRLANVEDELLMSDYTCAEFGTCAYLTAYSEDARVIEDITYNNAGDEVFVKKLARENKIIIKNLDIRNVYFDDRTTDFADDADQILIDYVTPEQFEAMKYNEAFDYQNLDNVGEYSKSEQVFWTQEDRSRLNTGLVEILRYWNKRTDRHYVIANRGILLRKGPNPYAHKELPIVPRVYGYVPYRKYGIGLCEALLNFKSSFNSLQEMIMDGIRRSNNSMFVVANGLTFDGNSFGFNNTLVKASKPLTQDSFQEIKGQQPNSAIFNYSNDLLKQVAIFVGIDPAAIIGEASSTAFETAVRTETSLERVNVALRNRDKSWKLVQRRHIANIMQFFPRKSAKELLEIQEDGTVDEGKMELPSIKLEGENYVNGEIVKANDDYLFEVKPEYIRGQFDIDVQTNFSAPTLKQLKLERNEKFINTVAAYANAVMAAPQLAEAMPFDDMIKELAFDYDIDLESIGGPKNSLAKEKKALMDQVKQVVGMQETGPGGVPVTPGGQPQPGQGAVNPGPQGFTANQQGPDISALAQNVRTPKTPGINDMAGAERAMM